MELGSTVGYHVKLFHLGTEDLDSHRMHATPFRAHIELISTLQNGSTHPAYRNRSPAAAGDQESDKPPIVFLATVH